MVSKTEEARVTMLENQVDNGGGGAWEYLCLVRKLKLRRSDKVLKHGLSILNDPSKRSSLGPEEWTLYEQVAIAAMDCQCIDVAKDCVKVLQKRFPDSKRVGKLEALILEAKGSWAEAEKAYSNLLDDNPLDQVIHKRRATMEKAQGNLSGAVEWLNKYLEIYMADQDAWRELAEIYVSLQMYKQAAFCYEELILSQPTNPLYHLAYADVLYTLGGHENLQSAKKYYASATDLTGGRNTRALFGICLCTHAIGQLVKGRNKDDKDSTELQSLAAKALEKDYKLIAPTKLSSLTETLRSLNLSCNVSSARQIKQETDQVKAECYRKVKAEQPDATTCISSSTEYDEWGQSNLSNSVSRAGCSSSIALSTPSLSRSSRFLTRFRLFPSNTSFKLSRTTSLGSSRDYSVSATSFTVSNEDDQLDLHRNEPQRGRNFLPACLITRSPPPPYGDFASGSLESNLTTSAFGDNLREDHTTSHLNVARDVDNARGEFNVNSHSSRNDDIDSIETRLGDRPMERNVRFSRTLSVGRLRDRVLRRSSFPDFTFSPLEQDREVRDASQQGGTQALSGGTGASASNDNALMSSSSSVRASTGMPSSFYSIQDSEVETFRARETRYHDLLVHRSNFLERRRRIRSQVHALQRLGSRFENLSGHERSCIISGQHRTGHCTCPIRTQNSNSSDDTSARASISRIVMLAEALFEVLDEIHQQSVVILPNVSSTGSVPAPHEVVEALPVKLYSKSPKHLCEEAAQCYICLVEYEGGDSVRILPCNHEFHRSCVDKWLKEIHRVCPLCRGDICGPDTVSSAN